MFLQPLEHSNYRQGAKRMRWAHLLVSPTRDVYTTRIRCTAVLLWLTGLFYQINTAGEKLQKGSGDVNGAIMWQGRAGMERAQKTPTRRSLPLPLTKKAASCFSTRGNWSGKEMEESKISTLLPPTPLISGYFCAHSCVTILVLSCVESREKNISWDTGNLSCMISRGVKNWCPDLENHKY